MTAPAAAQVFRPGVWSGSLEGTLEYERTDTSRGGGTQDRSRRSSAQETLTLHNAGAYVYDPRLLTLTLGGTFGLSQEWTDATGSGSRFHEGTLWGYTALATLLAEKPYSLELFANRNQSILSRELAGRTETETENRGARLHLRGLLLPSTLAFRHERLEDETRSGGTVTLRHEERQVVTYEGQRGWVDGEMDVRYEFVDLTDKVLSDLSYQSHEATAGHSLDFGSELNWRWDSRLRFLRRHGGLFGGARANDLTTWSVDETLRIDHSERLRSRYRYYLLHTETPGGSATTHTATASLSHQLYESLRTTATADGTLQSLTNGQRQTARGRLGLAYVKRLPGGGRLDIDLDGELSYEDADFRSAETFIPQEIHTAATPFALPLALRNPFAVEASIVVTKIGIAQPPLGCVSPAGPPTSLVLDRDYTLRTVDGVTEIVPIPCTGAVPGINPGDTIAVDYRATVSPSLRFSRTVLRAGVAVDYGWIRLFADHDRSDERLLAGRDGAFLDDERRTTVGAELRYEAPRLTASLLGEAARFESTREGLGFDRLRSSQRLTVRLRPELHLSVSADEAITRYAAQDRESRSLIARAVLSYRAGGLVAEAVGAYHWREDTALPDEETLEATLRLTWRFRLLELRPLLQYVERRQGTTETSELRAVLQVIRRF